MLEFPTEQQDVCVGQYNQIFRYFELEIVKIKFHHHCKKTNKQLSCVTDDCHLLSA